METTGIIGIMSGLIMWGLWGIYWVYLGLMENRMETTIQCLGCRLLGAL